MSTDDDSSKAMSAWPQLPAPRGKCHVRILVQDSVGLTSELLLPSADWDSATLLKGLVRAFVRDPAATHRAGTGEPGAACALHTACECEEHPMEEFCPQLGRVVRPHEKTDCRAKEPT